jgi:hypothetical protein
MPKRSSLLRRSKTETAKKFDKIVTGSMSADKVKPLFGTGVEVEKCFFFVSNGGAR